jgi:hypothetical protein
MLLNNLDNVLPSSRIVSHCFLFLVKADFVALSPEIVFSQYVRIDGLWTSIGTHILTAENHEGPAELYHAF